MSQFSWTYGIFGFVMVMLNILFSQEIFSAFQTWGLAAPGGYDTNMFNFYVALWQILPAVFFFAWIMWNIAQVQKHAGDYTPF